MARPALARTLKNQVFAWKMCQFSHLARLRARPNNPENEMKKYRKKSKRAANSARGKNQNKRSKIIIFGAASSPKSTPRLPKATPEASGSGWVTKSAKTRGQEHPRDASKGFRVPSGGQCDFRRGLREGSERAPSNRFCSPRPPGDGQLSKKSN